MMAFTPASGSSSSDTACRRRSRPLPASRVLLLLVLLLAGTVVPTTSSRANPAVRFASVSAQHTLVSGRISVTVDSVTYAYNVSVDGAPWFDSNGDSLGYSFSADGAQFSLAHGTLMSVGQPVTASGADPAGNYTSLALSWARQGGATVEYVTTFKAYKDRSVIVFRQDFPQALTGTAGTTFPSLRQTMPGRLGVLEYCGSSCGFMVGPHNSFPGISGGSGRGYSVITPLDDVGTGVRTSLAIGPVLEHFVNQGRNGGNSMCYGIHSTFEFVPAGFAIETSLVCNAAVYCLLTCSH